MTPHQVLFYDYVEDILDRRDPYRDLHLRRIASHPAIVMAGALGDPPHGAAIVFRGDDPGEALRFAAEDPYVVAGLVTAHRVERYAVVHPASE